MKTEQRIKDLILTEYKTLKAFAEKCELPYNTVDGILRRGFGNSNYENVFKICDVLGISADELGKGKIVPVQKTLQRKLTITELTDIVAFTKRNIEDYHDLTLDGKILTEDELNIFVDAIDLTTELIRRRRNRNGEK